MSTYGTTPTTPGAQTILITTATTGYSSDRVLKILLQVFRYLHLVLNVICAVIAGSNSGADDQSSSRIFFLVVTLIFLVASCGLLIWYHSASRYIDCIEPKPIHELIYYAFGSLLLFIASVIILGKTEPNWNPFFPYSQQIRQIAGVGIFNAGLYLASAVMFGRLSWRTQDS